MKTRFTLLFVLALAILLSACNSAILTTPAPHGDPMAPTAVLADPDVLAPTPEIFNPLDPSPTPSESTLPLTCQVTDLNVQVKHILRRDEPCPAARCGKRCCFPR